MLSIFDIFKIGIGPSSSHTVGPMWAGHRFLKDLREKGILNSIQSVRIGLYGSLALTGIGHGTDKASLLGLAGYQPDTINPDEADRIFEEIKSSKKMNLAGERLIDFDYNTQLIFHNGETLPEHPNAMRIFAADEHGIVIYYKTYLSIGGGFIVCADELNKSADSEDGEQEVTGPSIPYPFRNADELLAMCNKHNLTIAELVIENEKARFDGDIDQVNALIDRLWDVMHCCIDRGLKMGLFRDNCG